MTAIKLFQTYDQQVRLLQARGMDAGDRDKAVFQLKQVNYYRLSGYWYPFRRIVNGSRTDDFFPGTTLDERIHLNPSLLNSRAHSGAYEQWKNRYNREVADSHEDFVEHHRTRYGGEMPVWAAVEVLDWGGLTKLYGFSPRSVQDDVAAAFNLGAPQLESWLKSLNIVRNVCAHHGRFFNRVFALAPKLPPAGRFPALDRAASFTRTFGHLTLIQFLLESQKMRRTGLPALMRTFPEVRFVPRSHTGAPVDWNESTLWGQAR